MIDDQGHNSWMNMKQKIDIPQTMNGTKMVEWIEVDLIDKADHCREIRCHMSIQLEFISMFMLIAIFWIGLQMNELKESK